MSLLRWGFCYFHFSHWAKYWKLRLAAHCREERAWSYMYLIWSQWQHWNLHPQVVGHDSQHLQMSWNHSQLIKREQTHDRICTNSKMNISRD
jgi:hypothetical protein